MSLVLNVPEFCINQSPKYASGFEYDTILNISEFWIWQGCTEFRICFYWISLNMSGYVWISPNMLEYAWICLNLPEYILLYTSQFPHLFYSPCLLEHMTTYLNVYRRLEVIAWRNMRIFSWRDNIWFF